MSLTNALDAIAVVGAIVLVGEHKSTLSFCVRSAGGHRRHQQRGRRISHHRPHAQNVQVEPSDKTMTDFAGNQQIIEISISSPARCSFFAEMDERPATAQRGVRAGEIGMVLAIAGTLAASRHRRLQVDRHRARARNRHRNPARHGAHDRGPAADRIQPRFRRILRHAGRNRGILSAHPKRSALHDGCAVHGGHPRIADFYRQSDGAGKLQEILPQRPLTYKGQNFVNLSLLAASVVIAGYLVLNPGAHQLFPS